MTTMLEKDIRAVLRHSLINGELVKLKLTGEQIRLLAGLAYQFHEMTESDFSALIEKRTVA